jgi:hypothetical protein
MPATKTRRAARTLTARDGRGRFVALEIVEVADLAPIAVLAAAAIVVAAPVASLRREVQAPRLAPAAPVAPLRREVQVSAEVSSVALAEVVARVHADRLDRAAELAVDRRRTRRQLLGNVALAVVLLVPTVLYMHLHLRIF